MIPCRPTQPAPLFDLEPKYAGVVRAMRKFKAELDHTTAASTGAAHPGAVRDAATGDSGAGSPRLQAPACQPCAGAVSIDDANGPGAASVPPVGHAFTRQPERKTGDTDGVSLDRAADAASKSMHAAKKARSQTEAHTREAGPSASADPAAFSPCAGAVDSKGERA